MEQGKISPADKELEHFVLGTILLEGKSLSRVEDLFTPELFYNDHEKSIANAILSIYKKSQPIDILTVTHELKKMKRLDEVGGAYFVSHLTNRIASSQNLEQWVFQLSDLALRRALIFHHGNLYHKSFDMSHDVEDLTIETEIFLTKSMRGTTENSISSHDLAIETSKIIQMRSEMMGITGIATGFNSFDKSTGGWEDGTMIVLAARPGMGKTAAMLQFAAYPAIHDKIPVGIFSIEMPRTQIYMRMMAQISDISINKISGKSDTKMNHYDISSLHTKCQPLYDAPIFIDDTPWLTLKAFKSKSRKMVYKNGVQLLFIDYLQLMDSEYNGNKEQQISKISSSIKALAKELNIPIIAISSLNRSVELRGGDKRPQLSDLRDSGAIESDADMVIFLYRPDYYGIDEFDGGSSRELALFTIAKHRGGELGDIKLKWEGYKTKFSNYGQMSFDEALKPLERNEAF